MCTLNSESEFHLGLDESVEDMKGSFHVFSLQLLERTGKAVVFFPTDGRESFFLTDGGKSFFPYRWWRV